MFGYVTFNVKNYIFSQIFYKKIGWISVFLIWTILLHLILSLWHFGTKLHWLSFTSCYLQRGDKGHKCYLLAFQWQKQKQKTVGKFYCLVWKNYIPWVLLKILWDMSILVGFLPYQGVGKTPKAAWLPI